MLRVTGNILDWSELSTTFSLKVVSHSISSEGTEARVARGLGLTVKASMVQGMIQEAFVGLPGRPEDKHARVEAVGPSRVRSSGQLVPLEQLVYVRQDLRRTGTLSASESASTRRVKYGSGTGIDSTWFS